MTNFKSLRSEIESELTKHFPLTEVRNDQNEFNINICRNLVSIQLDIIDSDASYISSFFVNNFGKAANQNAGIGSLVISKISNCLELAGIERIDLEARMKGSYTWARAGFKPNQKDWNYIRSDISHDLTLRNILPDISEQHRNTLLKTLDIYDSSAMWIIADSAYGKELLIDRNWRGTLDLTDFSSKHRFQKYTDLGAERLSLVSEKVSNHIESYKNNPNYIA